MSKKLLMNNYSENEIDCDFYLKNKTFDGVSDYIDSGLNLLESNSDWCIYINFTDLGFGNGWIHIIHNMTEDPIWGYPGISLARTPQSMLDFTGYRFEFRNIVNLSTMPNNKIVFFRRGSKIGYKLKNHEIVEKGYFFTHTDKKLLIGCYQTAEGVKGRYWKGIINELIIYKNKTVTNEEINSLLQRG